MGSVAAGLMIGALGLGAFQAADQTPAPAPTATKAQTPQQLDTAADHQKMMDLLHIDKLRRGADGNNKDSPFYANYDESKANPYPYPDPLLLKNGKKVTSAKTWWNQRRPEIVEDFDREIYGRVPKNVPKVKWEVKNTTEGKNGDVDIVTKQLVGHVDNSSYPQVTVDIQTTLTLPKNAPGPVPVMILFGGGAGMPGGCGPAAVAAAANPAPADGPGRGGARAGGRGGAPGGPGRGPQGPTAQQQVLAKGWGYASLQHQQRSGG